jgi:transposase
MHSTTVAVDLAKNVFKLAGADSEGKIGERLRLNRARFSSFFVHRAPCRVLMEAARGIHRAPTSEGPAQVVRRTAPANSC